MAVGWCDVEVRDVQPSEDGFLSALVATCDQMSGRRDWDRFDNEPMALEVALLSSEDPSLLFAALPRRARVRVATEPESPGAGRQSWLVVETHEGSTTPVDPPEPGLRYPALSVTDAETIVPSQGLLNDVFEQDWYAGLGLLFQPSVCDPLPGACGEVASAVEMRWEAGEPVVVEPKTSETFGITVAETMFQAWVGEAWVNEAPRCTDMGGSRILFSQVALQP